MQTWPFALVECKLVWTSYNICLIIHSNLLLLLFFQTKAIYISGWLWHCQIHESILFTKLINNFCTLSLWLPTVHLQTSNHTIMFPGISLVMWFSSFIIIHSWGEIMHWSSDFYIYPILAEILWELPHHIRIIYKSLFRHIHINEINREVINLQVRFVVAYCIIVLP